jgi:FkbM family methyltransferase
MLNKLLIRLSDLLFAVRYCRNWQEIAGLLLSGKTPNHVVLKNGVSITSSQSPIEVTGEIFIQQVYMPAELTIGSDDVVVDIGANVGTFSVYAATKTRNRVLAVEPLPINCEYIQKNADNNKLNHISWKGAAVSDKSGTVNLYTTELVSGNLLFDHNVHGKIETYVEVPCTELRTIMDENNLAKIDLLKLDCEGSEGDILKSTPADYLCRIRQLAMEFHDNVSSMNHAEMQQHLESLGFKTKLNWNGRSPFGYLYAWQS